jgi:hypothetical protein
MIKKLFAYNNSDKERRIFDKKSDATKNFSIEHCFVGSIGISSTIDDDEKLYAVSKIDNEGGYLLYGPYKSYLPGQYQAVFTFKNFSKLKNNTIKIDIAYKGGEILSERSIQGSDLAVSPKQTIKFLLAQPEDNIEFRVFIGKGIELAVCRDVEVLSVSNSFQNFFGDIPNQYYTDFIKKHLNVLLALIRLGGKFYFKEERLLFESEDMIFVVQDEGDLTVMREIFLDVAYGLFHNFDAVAIDIGMNVGFVSLSLARNKHIKYIYSYEPFKQTYDRAIYNFNLNPKLSTKIKHYNFCVWNDCAEFNVKYDSKQSIGMSIKNNANDIEVDGGGVNA